MRVRFFPVRPNKMTLIIPPQTDSIWGTFEFYCISADFPHAEYLSKHNESGRVSSPVSLYMYRQLKDAFNQEMSYSFGKDSIS